MKKNTVLLAILILLTASISVFSQNQSKTPGFRGVFGSISALDNSYCEDETNDDIVPDVWKAACTDVVWKVSVDTYLNPDNPTWYTISGTGKTTVLHFIPDSVPSIYYGHPIVFTYEQSSGPILLESASDYTYVYKIPTIYNFGNDTVICPGETAALHLNGSETDIKYILQKDGIDYDSIVGNGSSLIFTPNVAGKYTVIAKHISDVACSRTMLGDADVSFYPPNTPTITGETTLCIDEATNITYTTESGMTNYEWVVSAGGTITSGGTTNQIIVDWSTSGSKTVTVNYENLNGCRALTPTSQTVNVYEKPVPVITGPSDVCINSVRNFSTASGMSEYVWTVTSGGNITSGSTTNSITIDWTTLGSQDVSVTYKDTHGCVPLTPTIKPVTVNERPIPTITGAQNLCEGTSGMTYTTEPGMSAYVWNIPSGGTITSGAGTNQVTVTWNTAGSRTITVNYNNSAGCNALTPSVLNVTVNPLPVPSIVGDNSICLNAELNSIYTTESGMNTYVWSVSAGGAINSGQGTDEIDVTWSTLGAKTINLTYKNEYGCSPINPVTFNATVYPLPVPTITGSDTVCAGVPNITYTTQSSKLNYDWQVSPGGTITSGAGTYQIKVTWNTLGDNWVSVNYENPTSCAALNPVIKNVYAKEEPTPSIIGPTSFCLDTASVKTYTTESAQSLYNWVVSAGGVIQSGSSTNQIKVKWYTAGAKTVSVNYTNSGGCSAATPTIIPVDVNPLPVPTINGLALVCAGVTGVTYTTEAAMTSYNWSVSAGGTITAGAGTNEITVSWNTSGPKTVSVNYSNGFGCTAKTSTVLNVTVNPAPTPTITGDAIRCVGSTGVVYSTQAGYFNYTWVVNGGTITNGAGTNSIQVTWNTIGNQSVSINYENASGCFAATPTIKPVEVLAIPVPVIIGSDSLCVGSTTIYSTEDGMSAYNWNVSAGGTIITGSGTNSITVQWNTAGSQIVSVNYTNPGNCQAATPTVMNVEVNPLAVPSIVGVSPVCVDTTGVIYTTEGGMTDYNWTINGGTITSGNGTNQITVTWTANGTKYVRVNYKNVFGCSALTPTQYNVTVNARPNPTINGNDTVCLGATNVVYTTEAGQSDYAWTISAGGTITSGSGTNTILVSWNVTGDQTVSVNYKNASGCLALTEKVFNVFVLTEPVPTITGPDPACVGNATYRTEAGMTNYTWVVSAGGTITAGASTRQISVKWNNDGPQTVSVNYNNAGGCSALNPTVKNVTVNPSPTPTIIGDNLVCADGANEIYTTESGMDTYTWGVSSGGVITSGAGTNQVTIAWSTGGAKIVTVNYLNAFSCSASTPTQYNVTVKPLPIPIITGKSTVCVGDAGVVYTTESGMSSYDWQISAGGSITSGTGTNSITVTWNNVGAQQVSVNYINADNCTANSPTIMNVDVQSLPVPTINGSNGGCLGSVTTYSTEAGMNSYVWSTSAGGTIVGGAGTNEISVLWNTAGPQTVEVNYITPIGCEPLIPTVKNCIVTTLPIPTISGDNLVCEGVPGNVYSTETSMTNYTWTVSSGGTITSGLGTNQIEVTWIADGTQTVAVNYQDANGCTALNPFEYNVNVKTAPVPTISGSNSVCKGSTGISYTTEVGMSSYLWSVSAGGAITSGIGTNSIEVSWNTQGNQSVGVNYTAVNGCTAINETTYPVTVKYVEALINASSLTVCAADTVTFTASSNGGLGATNYDFYVVSNGATPIQSGATAIYKTSTLNNGDQVYVKITDANGCEDYSDTITITINPLPSVNLAITSAKGNTICIGETVNFQASAGMVNYWYYINGAEINNGPNRNYSTSTLSNDDEIYVKAQSTFGCYNVSSPLIKMSVASVPVASISANPGTSIIQGSSVEFTASAGVDYQFLINGIIVQDYGADNTYASSSLNNGDIVLVNVRNANGCVSSTSLVMNVSASITPKMVQANPSYYCFGDAVGATVFINNPQTGLIYELIRTADSQNLGIGVVAGSVVSWNNVKNTTTGTQEYKVEAYYPAFPLSRVEMSNRINVVEYPLPSIYNISPTGTVNDCNVGLGYEIKLSDSDLGVNYELFKDGVYTGVSVAGTGNQLSFGSHSANGAYTIVAKNSTANCSSQMNGSFTINYVSTQIKYNLVSNPSNGHYCEGSSGVQLLLSGSTLNVPYILMKNATDSITTVIGTGNVLNMGTYTAVGVYTVKVIESSCSSQMNGSVTIIKDTKPTLFTVNATNNGLYCSGNLGVAISLSNQELGVSYQLMFNGNPLGAPINGTLPGAVLDFPGLYTAPGIYSVQQSNYSCVSSTVNNALVAVVSLPNDVTIGGDTTFCSGNQASIYIDNSETDVNYSMYLNNIFTGISSLGNGGQLNFLVNKGGKYTFTAQRSVSGVACPITLSESIVVSEKALPLIKNYTWISGSSCSNGTVITIEDSEIGVTYTVYSRTTGLPVLGYSMPGNGNDITFPGIVDSDGYYYIVAQTASGCAVEFTNFGDIHVTISGVVEKMEVITNPASVCVGDDVYIGLKDTESAITYDLYLNGGSVSGTDTIVQTITGNGSAMNFPSKIVVEGLYYVIGRDNAAIPPCPVTMLNTVQITFNPFPTVYKMTGSGIYCDGMSGAVIGLEDTEAGVEYFLQYDNGPDTITHCSIIGSGNPIFFNNITLQYVHSVYAVSPFGCTSTMNNVVSVLKKTTPNEYSVSIDNSNYCGTSAGASLLISGTQKDVSYVITNLNNGAVNTVVATADNASEVVLATIPEGDYKVEATWSGDACITPLYPTPISVQKAPVPSTPINISIDDELICAGDSTFVRVTNVEKGVIYDLMKNDVFQNRLINSATDSVYWKVDGLSGADDDYKVFGYFAGYFNCGQSSNKVVNLQVKTVPFSFALSPSNVSTCYGNPGITFSVSGSQADIIYELFDQTNTRVDNYVPAASEVGNPFTFNKPFTGGTYTLVASYITGRCSSSLNAVSIITEDDSSYVCFPFEAINDTLYLEVDQASNSMYVSNPLLGGNDIISSIDTNLSFKLITTWDDAYGNTIKTNGKVSFDTTNKDFFNYIKTASFFGKDSVKYQVRNLDHPNRIDTAVIYILVGNKMIDDERIILIPNAISPNGDGKNDKFIISGYDDQVSSFLQVFNRWGALVYQSTGEKYANDWEGVGNKGITVSVGKELPVGTYFYVFNVSFNQNGTILKKKYSGFVELRR